MEKSKTILIKYGGHAMLNEELKRNVLKNIAEVFSQGYKVVLVHGGGPSINYMLDKLGVESEFVQGQRVTSQQAMKIIEMSLKGEVNSSLVGMLNSLGVKAIGLSGKDGGLVKARKRIQRFVNDSRIIEIDLQQVGDVDRVDTHLLNLLLSNQYMPVLASIASGDDRLDYNINADIFAGHIAKAIKADLYINMTDVDGLYSDISDKGSMIKELTCFQLQEKLITFKDGMLPKLESCIVALEGGVREARIINGTVSDILIDIIIKQKEYGTLIKN